MPRAKKRMVPTARRILRPEWWDWRIVQAYYWRRYSRADRRAYRQECATIRWRAVWRGDVAPVCLVSSEMVAAMLQSDAVLAQLRKAAADAAR